MDVHQDGLDWPDVLHLCESVSALLGHRDLVIPDHQTCDRQILLQNLIRSNEFETPPRMRLIGQVFLHVVLVSVWRVPLDVIHRLSQVMSQQQCVWTLC